MSWPAIAAANNADWCDAVSRTHSLEAQVDANAWTSRSRTPQLFPDAVTLVSDPSIPELLSRIDSSPGCSIKDSFASLDLMAYGFRVLFDAHWIVRGPADSPTAPVSPLWTVVRDAAAFAAWENAWQRRDGSPDVLRAGLLHTRAVTVLSASAGGRVVGGAVLNRTGAVVGITNFFTEDSNASDNWQGCVALANALFPGTTFLGYESGRMLDLVRTQGFDSVGALRVWVYEA